MTSDAEFERFEAVWGYDRIMAACGRWDVGLTIGHPTPGVRAGTLWGDSNNTCFDIIPAKKKWQKVYRNWILKDQVAIHERLIVLSILCCWDVSEAVWSTPSDVSGSECRDPPFFGGYLWSKVPFFGPCLGHSLGRARFGNSSAS